MEAYERIPQDERLSGNILNEALNSFGVGDGQRLSDAELEKQVKDQAHKNPNQEVLIL